jgi:hypothetical protein
VRHALETLRDRDGSGSGPQFQSSLKCHNLREVDANADGLVAQQAMPPTRERDSRSRLSLSTASDQQCAAAIYAHSAGMQKNDGLMGELGKTYQQVDNKLVRFQLKIYDRRVRIGDHQWPVFISCIRDLLPATLIEFACKKML